MALRVGCPLWAFRGWVGNLFPPDAKPRDYLRHYAQVFGAVEANSTFYALPPEDVVARWREDVPEGFRFCFKLPRVISHERMLEGAELETERFFARMDPLGDRLGPFFLQLGPSFDKRRFEALARYLDTFPKGRALAVEVRHPDWFDEGETEAGLTRLLTDLGMDRVLFDSRPLFASKVLDATTVAAQGRKPRVPVRTRTPGRRPFVRFVGQNDTRAASGYLGQWQAPVTRWLDEGREVYFFTHAPDDTFAPRLGRVFTHLVARARPALVEAMPEWPGEVAPEPAPQLRLLPSSEEQP